MVLPIVGKTLVEVGVLFLANLFSLLHPDGLVLVEFFHFGGDFFYFLLFLLFFLLVFGDLNVFTFLLLFLIILIVRNLLLGGLLDLERNGERDELGVLLDKILELSFFQEFNVVGFNCQNDF